MIYKSIIAGQLLLLSTTMGLAEAPNIQTPKPVIYLADNLDEKDNLGWCIDTLGRGFAQNLQAHSCKPRGGDVQFSFEVETGLIRSVEFSKYCMQHNADRDPVFGLVICNFENVRQQFAYNTQMKAITLASDQAMCVSVGEASRSAGPFMSRALLLQNCSKTDALYRTWIIAKE